MKKIIVLLLSLPFCGQAQKNRIPFTEKRVAVSFSPLALAAVDYTLLMGVEYKLSPRLFTANEAGYVFASGYINTGESPNKGTGFLLRPSLKWFVADNNRFYLQPQFFYKQVTHKMYGWVGKDPVNGVPAYEQLQDFRYRRKIVGGNIITGFVSPMDHRGKGYMDLYLGLGFRKKKSMVVEPNTVYERNTEMFGPADEGVFPNLAMGLRFIYAFR